MEEKIYYNPPEFEMLGLEPEEDIVTASFDEEDQWTGYY